MACRIVHNIALSEMLSDICIPGPGSIEPFLTHKARSGSAKIRLFLRLCKIYSLGMNRLRKIYRSFSHLFKKDQTKINTEISKTVSKSRRLSNEDFL